MTEHVEGCEIIEGVKFYHITQQGAALRYERNWLVSELILTNGTGMLVAGSKVGKTLFCCELAIAVSRGEPFLNKYPTARGKVLMWLCEDPEDEVKVKMQETCEYHGVDQSALGIIWGDSMEGLNLEMAEDQARLIAIIKHYAPSLVILDSFSSFYGGDENTASSVKEITRKGLLRIARSTRTAIIVTHHEKDTCGSRRGGKRMRGSSELHAWGDHYMFLERTKDGDNLFYTDQRTNNITPHRIRLDEPAGKEGPKGLVAEAIRAPLPEAEDKKLDLLDDIRRFLGKHKDVKFGITAIRDEVRGHQYTKFEPACEWLYKHREIERGGRPSRYLYWMRSAPARTKGVSLQKVKTGTNKQETN
jgi:hypothetical protein